jgi:hypothetical protein
MGIHRMIKIMAASVLSECSGGTLENSPAFLMPGHWEKSKSRRDG